MLQNRTGWFAIPLVLLVFGSVGCSDAGSGSAAEGQGVGSPSADPAARDAAAPSVGIMAPAELASRLGTESEPVILDVRSPREFSAGHIPGAINVPYDRISEHLDWLEAFRGREIVVYCRTGRRAGVAEAALAAEGFEGVLDLEGHMRSWQEEDRPVAIPTADCC